MALGRTMSGMSTPSSAFFGRGSKNVLGATGRGAALPGAGGGLGAGQFSMGGGGMGAMNQAVQAPQLPTQPSAQANFPAAQQYQAYGGAGGGGAAGAGVVPGGAGGPGPGGMLGENLAAQSAAGQGMLDPGSDYYQRLSQAMQGQIGGQMEAQRRAAALRGAWSGFGAGASPEMLATQGDISQAGLGAQGAAEAGLALQAPGMGMQAMQGTFAPLLGIQQLGEQSRQFGAGMGERARQFGIGTGMQQQQMAAQQAAQQAQLQQQAAMANQQAQMQQMQMMAQMAGMFGGY